MRIEAVSKSGGLSLSGKREVWVRVLSNEVHDWSRVQDKLNAEQAAMLDALGIGRKLAYYPHSPIPEEREEHGYNVDDHWVWSAK
jgi:hypothetical protein